LIALLYAVANRTQYLRPTANGTTLLYSPTAPFLLAGAVLLPPLPLLVLALVTTPPHSRHRWNNLSLRVGTMSAASLAYWGVLGALPQQISQADTTTQAGALLAAMAAFEIAQLVILNGSIWLTDGISLARQAATWGTEYLSGEVWELSAGAAAAALALTAPVLLVPAAGLLILIVRQTQYAQAIHDRDRDAKTGLLNMRAFTRLADRELSSARRHGYPLAFLMLDVDHLRAINTEHGHVGGDAAIATVASVLTEHLRDEDLAARFGGEEFAVALPHTDLRQAAEAAERIRRAIEEAGPQFGTQTLRVTVSIGVSRFCPSDSLDDLLVSADRALYEAKDDGRNLVRLAVRTAVEG
jgi:diguanylate cyclase (GGDEF)-like protein